MCIQIIMGAFLERLSIKVMKAARGSIGVEILSMETHKIAGETMKQASERYLFPL
ncbi:MAG: hypothetical protein JSV16_04190 [Candidatus Hydrogenedentota bacterium]|nr:MAG: hypothetical protein JSV16_04190 [Candidatus Hydrogenedentota bacterium]